MEEPSIRMPPSSTCPIGSVIPVLPPPMNMSWTTGTTQAPPFKPPLLHRGNVQVAVFVLFAFCTLGPYNGLNALGGGGLKDHLLATKMNCVYAFSLAILGWIGGACFNYYGCRAICSVSSVCYLSYVLVLLAVTFFDAPPFLVYPTGVILGLGASFLWASFGAISIRYPILRYQPRTFATMWCLTNLGGFSCGLLSLFVNFSGSRSSQASLGSFLALCCLASFGLLVAGIFLRHQETVFRSDGEPAGNSHATSMRQTIKQAVMVFADERIRPLYPIFLAPFAHMPFLFNGLNGQYFNIRSRSLNSSLYWFSRIPGGLLFFLVSRETSRTRQAHEESLRKCMARRLLPGLYLNFAWAAVCLAFSHFSIFNSFGNIPPPEDDDRRLDFWNDWPRSLLPMIPFAAFGILDALVQSLLYNLLGFLAGKDSRQAALYSGLYKTLQSITVGLVWGLDWGLTRHEEYLPYAVRYKVHWAIMCLCWAVAFPGTLHHMLKIRKMPNPTTAATTTEIKPVLTTRSTNSGGAVSRTEPPV